MGKVVSELKVKFPIEELTELIKSLDADIKKNGDRPLPKDFMKNMFAKVEKIRLKNKKSKKKSKITKEEKAANKIAWETLEELETKQKKVK